MALVPKKLYRGIPATSSGTACYTVPDEEDAFVIVKEIIIYNSTTSSASVDLHCIPSGGSMATNNQFWGDFVPPKGTVQMDLSLVLERDETLHARQYNSNALVLTISGVVPE